MPVEYWISPPEQDSASNAREKGEKRSKEQGEKKGRRETTKPTLPVDRTS
jgi:hypothetical protein